MSFHTESNTVGYKYWKAITGLLSCYLGTFKHFAQLRDDRGLMLRKSQNQSQEEETFVCHKS